MDTILSMLADLHRLLPDPPLAVALTVFFGLLFLAALLGFGLCVDHFVDVPLLRDRQQGVGDPIEHEA